MFNTVPHCVRIRFPSSTWRVENCPPPCNRHHPGARSCSTVRSLHRPEVVREVVVREVSVLPGAGDGVPRDGFFLWRRFLSLEQHGITRPVFWKPDLWKTSCPVQNCMQRPADGSTRLQPAGGGRGTLEDARPGKNASGHIFPAVRFWSQIMLQKVVNAENSRCRNP